MGSIPTAATNRRKNKMKTIYYAYADNVCTEEQFDRLGEVEGMFDEQGKLIGAWCLNDGNWRSEYFDPFMEALGIQVDGLPPELNAVVAEEFINFFGV